MNANLIFKWLRDPRFTPDGEADEGSVFLPVEIVRNDPIDAAMVQQSLPPAGRLQIELAGGHRIVADGGFDPDALGRLLKGWLS